MRRCWLSIATRAAIVAIASGSNPLDACRRLRVATYLAAHVDAVEVVTKSYAALGEGEGEGEVRVRGG